MIMQTILILDILDNKTDTFVRFSDHHSKYGPFTTKHIWTIQIPDLSGIQMVIVSLIWWMLKGPPLIPRIYIFSVL